MSTENLIRTGNFVDTDFCYHELPEILDVYDYDTFNKNKEHTDFYVVCSDVEKGKPVYAKLHDMKRDIDYIRASASLPYVSYGLCILFSAGLNPPFSAVPAHTGL